MFNNYIMNNWKKILSVGLFFIILLTCFYIFYLYRSNTAGVVYTNKDYGFSFSLPDSWKGYSVTVDKWTGNKADDQLGDVVYTTGPVISIHNPKWSGEHTYQDIPIMIFTISQWNELSSDKFHIGAAPIGPSELRRNSKYVLALPARYNFAFPSGFEEVEQILKSNPIKVFTPKD
jgi:hypothetical protein